MLILDNYGMTFSQFIDRKFIKSFQHGNEERKPFRQNFTGIRMFTSLWNWRASLLKFNDALDKWMIANDYDKSIVNALIEIDQLRYDANHTSDISERNVLEQKAQTLLQNNNLTENDLQSLRDFNTKELIDIPIFRLGFSKNGNGFYVQGNVDVSGSSVYNKDKVDLLAITPDKAEQFEFLIDRILSALEYSNKFGHTSLGLRLLHDDGSNWNKDEFIDLNPKSPHRRTLSKLLSLQDRAIVLHADGKNIKYEGGNGWSMIPTIISNIVRTVTYFQHHPDEITEGVQFASVQIPNGEEKFLFKTQIDDLFSEKYLATGNDSSLFDLLNLVFHGTVQDIHQKLTKGTKLAQVEDAYFKRGFFINPDISRRKTHHGDYEIHTIKDVNGNVVFYPIETSSELFTVDTEVRTSGLGLRINEIFKDTQDKEKKIEEQLKTDPKEDPILKFKEEYPELSRIIADGIEARQDFEYNLDSEQEVVEWRNDINIRNIQSAIDYENQSVLNFPYKIMSVKGHVTTLTLKEHIMSAINASSIKIKFKDGLIIQNNEEEYKLNDDFTLSKLGSSIVSSKYDQKLSNNKTVKETILDILSNDKIREELVDFGASQTGLGDLYRGLKDLFDFASSEEEISAMLNKLGYKEDASEMTDQDTAYDSLMAYIGIMADTTDGVFKELNDILINC
jgi:hypothetical protein